MSYPIYLSDSHSKDITSNKANQGLRFERFYDQYSYKNEQSPDYKPKFLNKFSNKICGDKSQLERYALRQLELVKKIEGDGKVYQLTGHFVTGIGNSHFVENGFTWHYTQGVPYLPGSQVKGLVRAVIELYCKNKDQKELLQKWFGSCDKNSDENQVGELIFFDALPMYPPKLSVDVMTSHMHDWYSSNGKFDTAKNNFNNCPGDWHLPNPIPFLVVKAADFFFSIGKRAGSNIDIKDVFLCLDSALNYLGAGAKTQTGYGFMKENSSKRDYLFDKFSQKKREREAQGKLKKECSIADSSLHSQLLREIHENNWRSGDDVAKNSFTTQLKKVWLPKVELNKNETACIELLVELARMYYKTQFKNPHHKRVKPNQREWICKLLSLKKTNS